MGNEVYLKRPSILCSIVKTSIAEGYAKSSPTKEGLYEAAIVKEKPENVPRGLGEAVSIYPATVALMKDAFLTIPMRKQKINVRRDVPTRDGRMGIHLVTLSTKLTKTWSGRLIYWNSKSIFLKVMWGNFWDAMTDLKRPAVLPAFRIRWYWRTGRIEQNANNNWHTTGKYGCYKEHEIAKYGKKEMKRWRMSFFLLWWDESRQY